MELPKENLADALSLTRDCRKTVSSLKVRCMECAQEEQIDALSLTRERVRVWVSENLSLQKLNSAQKKDRHPHPPSPIDKWERAQKMYSR